MAMGADPLRKANGIRSLRIIAALDEPEEWGDAQGVVFIPRTMAAMPGASNGVFTG
jgi:hypothetical protein